MLDRELYHGQSQRAQIPVLSGLLLKTNNVDQARSHMSNVLHPHRIYMAGCRELDFKHHQGRLKNISLNAMDYGTTKGDVTVSVPPMESNYLVHFCLGGACEVEVGEDRVKVPTGAFTVLSPFKPLKVKMSHDHVQLSVQVPRSLIDSILAQEVGFRPNKAIEFAPNAYPSQTGSLALTRLVQTICSDFADGIPGVTHARVAASLEDCFVRLMLATLKHNYSADMDAAGQAPAPAPYYVRRVEEYIRANAGEAISIANMVEAAGVSPRSLHSGFKRFRNTSPMAYLRNYRLELARETLMNALNNQQSVTDTALACGFNHLSKFARDYQMRFGEKPSQTRRRTMAH